MNEIIKISLFQDILKSVTPLGIAVLSGYREYPRSIQTDIDIIGTEEVLDKLKLLAARGDCKAVQVIQHEATCYYWIFHQADEQGHPVFLHFDFALDYRWKGMVFYRAEELLSGGRVEVGLPLLSVAHEFGYYFIKKIGKGNLESRHEAILSDLFQQDSPGCERELLHFLPRGESQVVARAAATRNWSEVQTHLRQMRRAMLLKVAMKRPLDIVFYYVGEALRWVKRVIQPTGLVVAFLGPDGSGKSTVAEHLTRDLQPAFRHARIVHLRPSLRPRTGNGPVSDPHGQPPRGFLPSLAKIFYWWAEILFGWLVNIQPAKIHSTFIVFDRYYHDLFVDPKRYRFSGPMNLARLIGRLIPQPDLFFILDLPPETALARKPEMSLLDARLLRERYLELGKSLPNANVVDASLPLEEVILNVDRILLNYMEHRLKNRLGL